jgi:hypothetical protein
VAKQYGVTCDKCHDKIPSPAYHAKLTIKEEITNVVTRVDLCVECLEKIRVFLSNKENK